MVHLCMPPILRPPSEQLATLGALEVFRCLMGGFVLQQTLVTGQSLVAEVTDKALVVLLHMPIQLGSR